MSKGNADMQQLSTYLSESLAHLQNDEDLTLEECKTIIDELDKVKAISAQNATKSEDLIVNMTIDEMINDFNSSADGSTKLLQDMLTVVAEGRVPEKDSVAALDTSIAEMQEKYDSILKYVSLQVPEEDMPVSGSPVMEYADALERNKSIKLQQKIDAIFQKLGIFLSVKSLIETYSDALMPYQKKAEELLGRIADSEEVDWDDIEEQNAGTAAFVEALPCVDGESSDAAEKLERVAEFFPLRVYTGLAGNKYFIDKELLDRIETVIQKNLREPVAEITETNEYLEGNEDGDAGEAEAKNGEDTNNNSDIDGDVYQGSEFVRSIVENGALIKNDENIGFLKKDVSNAENKKITVSIFMNEIRKMSVPAVKDIIKSICESNCVSPESVAAKGMSLHLIQRTLTELKVAGYLSQYEMMGKGEFYCATKRLIKALNYKDASRYVGVRQRAIDTWGEDIEDKETSAAARIAFTQLKAVSITEFLNEKEILHYNESEMFCTDAFCYGLQNSDDSHQCLIIVGAFWDDTTECDEDFRRIKHVVDEKEELPILIVAGFDRIRAKGIAEALLKNLEFDFSNTRVSLYSFSDKEFYSYDSLERLEQYEAYYDEHIGTEEEDDENSISEETVEVSDKQNEEAVEPEGDYGDTENADSCDKGNSENVSISSQDGTDSSSSEITNATADVLGENDSSSRKVTVNEKYNTEKVRGIITGLLSVDCFYAATAFAKACTAGNEENQKTYELLAYALNDPMAHCIYSTDNAFNLIAKRTVFDDLLVISTALRTFFSNQVRFDYKIKSFYNGVKDYDVLSKLPALSNVLYSLAEFKDEYKKGMDVYAGYHVKSQAELGREITKVRNDANSFYESYVISRKKENASQKRFLETKKLIFSVNSDFGVYIKSIIDNDRDLIPLMKDFLQTEFLKDDESMSEDSISSEKLWDYIVRYWDKAGEAMMYRKHVDLMSHLRSNITNVTLKAVQLLVRWCALVEQASTHVEDEGTVAYKRKYTPLLSELDKAAEEIDAACKNDTSIDEKAGLHVLHNTVNEIRKCMDGSYDEKNRKYFYAPFLLTDDVILDGDFLPDLNTHGAEIDTLYPTYRILEHVRTIDENNDYDARLKYIMNKEGGDNGTALRIIEYLTDVNPSISYAEKTKMVMEGISHALEYAGHQKNNFIGELELAQSYGQIDNSTEDKKEKILQIIDGWFEWAKETRNFDFFDKVMDCYLADIKEKAKEREKTLLEELELYRNTQIPGLTTEIKEKRVKRIEAMIKEQNYTVAEDLLSRPQADDEHEDVIDEDFLKEFLDSYDYYYKMVATRNANFSSLVSSRTRNKEERGAKRLAENWLPGGSRLGRDRLTNLLNGLGFKVGSVKEQAINGRFESYVVVTAAAAGVQRENYTHPIAAFGSGASREGFRVVCVNGAYDADGLIDVMKQIGNSKHTLILHDYALTLSERRRLARKAKNALGDKFFGVIDRTIMMYLVRKYDETRINRMLISLIMPFGYYQPYVWESVNVMPPEIFMGRKKELERIKTPTGVNIVYGGRQLGKSALLKKAKEDIDGDENGNRAIYIDIKGLNYEEAANKIGHELYDQYILAEDIDTKDWSELSRIIKRRLQDQTKKIPYLLLLLDEADTFIESCESVNYKPLDALKDIQNIGTNRFKFVIAGLRNIVRFKREVALGNNSVLTHLEAMTVKPFNTMEARELMEIPLHYLGLRFPKDKESLVTLILASTNYFPGLIQMYCAKLLEAMRNKDYAGYDEVSTPLYEVSEAHIKKVLADPEFMQQIREKFVITLKLDEDNYYYLIALIMAYLYHQNGYSEGYSAEDIHNAGSDLDINKIAELEIQKLAAFMEELRELNILRSTDNTRYLFTRFTFFQMMGTSSEVEDKLTDYMEV